eukprot:TRINITY_DN19228_c0_g1_i1.p1 TRINITY_DN19228_c0_g1~~TRINITY_DN19228_c0_g1_i1.p1  ORF type:complete len:1134 (+),score=143.14 TRINITY_DN19228_c0_g1_i1:415-3402(+)
MLEVIGAASAPDAQAKMKLVTRLAHAPQVPDVGECAGTISESFVSGDWASDEGVNVTVSEEGNLVVTAPLTFRMGGAYILCYSEEGRFVPGNVAVLPFTLHIVGAYIDPDSCGMSHVGRCFAHREQHCYVVKDWRGNSGANAQESCAIHVSHYGAGARGKASWSATFGATFEAASGRVLSVESQPCGNSSPAALLCSSERTCDETNSIIISEESEDSRVGNVLRFQLPVARADHGGGWPHGPFTIAMCYCPDENLAGCQSHGAFVQQIGIMHFYFSRTCYSGHKAAKCVSQDLSIVWPGQRFALRVDCPTDACSAEGESRVKIVTQSADEGGGSGNSCSSALHGLNAHGRMLLPSNVNLDVTFTHGGDRQDYKLWNFPLNKSEDSFAGFMFMADDDSRGYAGETFDVCFCNDICGETTNWFKVGVVRYRQLLRSEQPAKALLEQTSASAPPLSSHAAPTLPLLMRSLRAPRVAAVVALTPEIDSGPQLLIVDVLMQGHAGALRVERLASLQSLVAKAASTMDLVRVNNWSRGSPWGTQPLAIRALPKGSIPAARDATLALLTTDSAVYIIELAPGDTSSSASVHAVADPVQGRRYCGATLGVDVDGDGFGDLLVTRAPWPSRPGTTAGGDLLWLRQPSTSDHLSVFRFAWSEVVLATGAAGPIAHVRLHGASLPSIAVAEEFRWNAALDQEQVVVLYWCEGSAWSECLPGAPARRQQVLGTVVGAVTDMEFVDLNGDGFEDLLVVGDRASDGYVGAFAFEQPRDSTWKRPWSRHVLSYWSLPSTPTCRDASPHGGSGKVRGTCKLGDSSGKSAFETHNLRSVAVAFRRQSRPASPARPPFPKPEVMLSYGAVGLLNLLVPRHAFDPSDWTYSSSVMVQTTGGVGRPAVLDADGDGNMEVFVPRPGDDTLDVFTFGDVSNDTSKCGLCWDCLNRNGRCSCCCAKDAGCSRCAGFQATIVSLATSLCGPAGGCGECLGTDVLRGEACACLAPQVTSF